MRRRWPLRRIGACLVIAVMRGPDALAETLTIGDFSSQAPGDRWPAGWELILPNPEAPATHFRLETAGRQTVLRADAERSMAGLSKKVRIDLERLAYLCWRWKIAAPLVKADLRTRQGDDYAARLYVLFDYATDRLPLGERLKLGALNDLFGLDVPAAALNYVWDNRHPVGTVTPNAYTDRARMWVLRSGPVEAGRWVVESRNLKDDFRRAFGEDAPAVAAVVVASDTDNTGENATAWFGDIRFASDPGVCAR